MSAEKRRKEDLVFGIGATIVGICLMGVLVLNTYCLFAYGGKMPLPMAALVVLMTVAISAVPVGVIWLAWQR